MWSFISTVLRLRRVQRDKFVFILPPNGFHLVFVRIRLKERPSFFWEVTRRNLGSFNSNKTLEDGTFKVSRNVVAP